MAGAPPYKVIDPHGTYQASCKEPEAAASLANFYGAGTTVRYGSTSGPVIYAESPEGVDSWDVAAETMLREIDRVWQPKRKEEEMERFAPVGQRARWNREFVTWRIRESVGGGYYFTHPDPIFSKRSDAKRAADEWNAYEEDEERETE